MTRKEYTDIIREEIYRKITGGGMSGFISKFRAKYITPNTNCQYLIRKMQFYNERGALGKVYAKIVYLRIVRRYSCWIHMNSRIGKGFYLEHPVGIVMGECIIGNNCTLFQNTTIGKADVTRGSHQVPIIGDNVTIGANACILGNIKICDSCVIGAGSIVLKDVNEPGTYVGIPVHKVK